MTLVLPWAGCQYAREFESALRQSQENALADSAGAISRVISEKPSLLVRDPVQLVSAAGEQDVYARRLPSFVTLDGFVGDWDINDNDLLSLPGPLAARYSAGIDATSLWLFVNVSDDTLRYETPATTDHDRIVIDYEDPAGTPQSLLIATAAVGRTAVRRLVAGQWQTEPGAQAVWEETGDGYQVELRMRNELVGARFGLTVFDSDSGLRSSTFAGERPGYLLHRLPRLEQALADFRFDNRRLVVVDDSGWLLAAVGDTRTSTAGNSRNYPLLERLFRQSIWPSRDPDTLREARQGRLQTGEVLSALDGVASSNWYSTADERSAIVVAAHPINVSERVIGAVVLEQTSDAILTLTDRALTRLLTLTLGATLLAAVALVGFATYLSLRIRRLSQAAELAMTPEGRINAAMPETGAGDEIGDLSRSFSGLLARLREHTDYLRTLAGKLSHELRTPLAVVQSSLDNLEAGELPEGTQVYATRAREGAVRLRSILTAMSEASRVEQAIEQAETERFDMRAVVDGCVQGYRDIHQDKTFELDLPAEPCPVVGVPELIAQMLDKLVDNAADFSTDGAAIRVSLAVSAGTLRLAVANPGPPIPRQMQGQLFDSMVSLRSTKGDTPHLGFGLHIARLIAEYHDGSIGCRSLDDPTGAEFFVIFPR
ncbi:MAG: hypothetical protein KJO55_01540 [Gammaproteobacteria bacterium]|nr:hypothetical protein [Gammaproteobacteria bacterium]